MTLHSISNCPSLMPLNSLCSTPCTSLYTNYFSQKLRKLVNLGLKYINKEWCRALYKLHKPTYCIQIDFSPKMSYLGVGVSPGNVPVYSNLKVFEKRVRVAELVLRCLIFTFAVVSAVLVGTDSQLKEVFTVRKEAKFTDMKALVFLVVANGLGAAYSLAQVSRCVMSLMRGGLLFNKPLAWAIFSGDQVMAYLSVAAVAAAAQSATVAKLGQPAMQWMEICDMYGKFCNQIGEGLGSAVLMSLSMVLLSVISGFSLFRLYGQNKTKNAVAGGGW